MKRPRSLSSRRDGDGASPNRRVLRPRIRKQKRQRALAEVVRKKRAFLAFLSSVDRRCNRNGVLPNGDDAALPIVHDAAPGNGGRSNRHHNTLAGPWAERSTDCPRAQMSQLPECLEGPVLIKHYAFHFLLFDMISGEDAGQMLGAKVSRIGQYLS
jgi:hypothetical protein